MFMTVMHKKWMANLTLVNLLLFCIARREGPLYVKFKTRWEEAEAVHSRGLMLQSHCRG